MEHASMHLEWSITESVANITEVMWHRHCDWVNSIQWNTQNKWCSVWSMFLVVLNVMSLTCMYHENRKSRCFSIALFAILESLWKCSLHTVYVYFTTYVNLLILVSILGTPCLYYSETCADSKNISCVDSKHVFFMLLWWSRAQNRRGLDPFAREFQTQSALETPARLDPNIFCFGI